MLLAGRFGSLSPSTGCSSAGLSWSAHLFTGHRSSLPATKLDGSSLAEIFAWVAGGTWQPAFLQGYDHPVSLFAESQHTWWPRASAQFGPEIKRL
jgi:hypothetical protein